MSFHLFKSSTNKITGESKFLFSGFIFNLFSSLIIGLSVGLLVLAFNNPTGNPTTGGGIIGVGSGAPAGSLYINSSGNVGIGTTDPGTYKLKVIGTAQMTGFQLGTSATAGHILTADTSGVGTWQVAPAGGITSLNGLTGATQTFTNDTNVAITSAGTAHTLGWTGTLAEARIGAGAISQTKLKTAIGEVSASGTLEYPQTLPGG